jgi:hypothetical protein
MIAHNSVAHNSMLEVVFLPRRNAARGRGASPLDNKTSGSSLYSYTAPMGAPDLAGTGTERVR